jgi:5-methylphenazine-1-carboxylate 1-monooxygenase
MRAIVIGAGIGGCVAAMSLRQRGIDVTVYEAVREVQPLGVGINILPHAMAVLDWLGIMDDIVALGVPTAELAFFNQGGQLLWREPRGMAAGYPVPQLSVHRGRLQMELLRQTQARIEPDNVRTAMSLSSFTTGEHDGRPTVTLLNRHTGETETDTADVVIASDGIHSTVRRRFYPTEGLPHWSGNVLWRATTEHRPFLTGSSMFMAGHLPHKFVAYPITTPDANGNQVINWIAELNREAEGLSGREDWNKRVDTSLFADRFADWKFDWLDIPNLIDGANEVFEFPMVDRDPVERWTFGKVTLLGDAAHPMYPIGSNGASQAMLDGAKLSEALAQTSTVEDGLRAYEGARRPMTAKIVLSNRSHGPERVLDLAHERAPQGFTDLGEVFAEGELEEISATYKQLAGFSRPQ